MFPSEFVPVPETTIAGIFKASAKYLKAFAYPSHTHFFSISVPYRLYVFGEIFDIGNQSYQNVFFAIDFDEESSNYKITQKKLDIEQSEYEQIAKSGAQKYLITDNYNGEFLQEDISDNLVVKRYFDYSLLCVLIFLICLGFVLLYSASSYSAQLAKGDAS